MSNKKGFISSTVKTLFTDFPANYPTLKRIPLPFQLNRKVQLFHRCMGTDLQTSNGIIIQAFLSSANSESNMVFLYRKDMYAGMRNQAYHRYLH